MKKLNKSEAKEIVGCLGPCVAPGDLGKQGDVKGR